MLKPPLHCSRGLTQGPPDCRTARPVTPTNRGKIGTYQARSGLFPRLARHASRVTDPACPLRSCPTISTLPGKEGIQIFRDELRTFAPAFGEILSN